MYFLIDQLEYSGISIGYSYIGPSFVSFFVDASAFHSFLICLQLGCRHACIHSLPLHITFPFPLI